jgi:hypothetical protein
VNLTNTQASTQEAMRLAIEKEEDWSWHLKGIVA